FFRPLARFDHSFDKGDDHFRVLFGIFLSHDNAVEIGDVGFTAIEDLAAGTTELHDLGPRAEVRVSANLVLGDVGSADGRALIFDFNGVAGDAFVLQRLQGHTPSGTADRHGDILALEMLKCLDRGADRYHDCVTGTMEVITRSSNVEGPETLGFLELGAIND